MPQRKGGSGGGAEWAEAVLRHRAELEGTGFLVCLLLAGNEIVLGMGWRGPRETKAGLAPRPSYTQAPCRASHVLRAAHFGL